MDIFLKSEVHASSLAGTMFMCGLVGDETSMFFIFYEFLTMLGSCLRVFMGSSSRSGANNVSCWSIFSGATLFELRCTIPIHLEGIVPYLINGTVKNLLSKTTCN